MSALGDFHPIRTNDYVPNMSYAADVSDAGIGRIDLGTPIAADPNGILDGQSIATAGSTSVFAAAYDDDDVFGRFGRNITVVADSTATSKVYVRGRDYLGQFMMEEFTLNSGTPVVGKKAFKHVDSVEWDATASRTIDVGWGTALGMPYALVDTYTWLLDGAESSNTPTVVTRVATDPQTATTGDPRGTIAPHSSDAANGSRHFEVIGLFLVGNLYGVEHYFA